MKKGAPGGDRTLWLVTLDGQSIPIATLGGEYPAFDFYFE